MLDIVRLKLSIPNSDENPSSPKGLVGACKALSKKLAVVASLNMNGEGPPYISISAGLELGLTIWNSEFISIIKGSEKAMVASGLKIGTSKLERRPLLEGNDGLCVGEKVGNIPELATMGTVMVGVVSGVST